MASKRKRLRCDVRAGLGPDGPQCQGDAAYLGIDDEGDTHYFCGRCAPQFEGGMSQMRHLPGGRT